MGTWVEFDLDTWSGIASCSPTSYQDRQSLASTYLNRHHVLSDGKDEANFKGKLDFDWDAHHYTPKKRRATTTAVKEEPTVKKQKTTDQPSKPMIYDVEKGCLVPFE